MSMICNFRQVPPKTLDKIKNDSSLTESVFFPEYNDCIQIENGVKIPVPSSVRRMVDEMEPEQKKKFLDEYIKILSLYRGILEKTGAGKRAVGRLEVGPEMDIDKAWHGIHFLLTGESKGGKPPLAHAIMGGREIGRNVGYGPVKYLEPKQVKEIYEALSKISTEEMQKRYDLEAMRKAQIYTISDDDKDPGYFIDYYKKLVEFYGDAAGKGYAVFIYMT